MIPLALCAVVLMIPVVLGKTCLSEQDISHLMWSLQNCIEDMGTLELLYPVLCGSRGWTRVAYLDMSDPSQQCPTDFSYRLYDESGVRACGRQTSSVGGCNSVTFSTYDISYSQVCGRVLGYQYGSTDAISDYNETRNRSIKS